MKKTALLIIAAFLFVAGAAFADTTEETLNVQNGSTKLKLSAKLEDSAIDALTAGESVSIQNDLSKYLCAPTKLIKNKKGYGKKNNTQKIAFKSKNGKYNWTEKDVTKNFYFAIGNVRVKSTKAVLKSSGMLVSKDFTDFDTKDITLLDVLGKEAGLDRVAGYSFKPKSKGTNFTHSSEEQDLQVNFAANTKGKANISFKFSSKVVSPAIVEESGPSTDFQYTLKIIGEGDVNSGYVGSNLVEFQVTRNLGKFRYYSYDGIKVTNDFLSLELVKDTEVTAVFGTYDLNVQVSGSGTVNCVFVGPDEFIATAIPGEEDFSSFEVNGTVYQDNPLQFTMTNDTELLAIFKGEAPPPPPPTYSRTYMVIDLSEGPNALSYPVSYLEDVPAGGWSDVYKTTKLVLRRVSPGTFKMGCRNFEVGRENDEVWHNVTLTNAFYVGVFEVTQQQYALVTGENPSYFEGDKRPVDSVSYVDIRGNNEGSKWPMSTTVDEGSFLWKLRSRTKFPFDLPTEAQWEYACRAGSTVAWNSGVVSTDTEEDPELDKLGRYANNSKDGKGGYEGVTTVGSYLPNAWGLYDMHGNVNEWCLDFYDEYTGDATEPIGPNFASDGNKYRVIRGGGTTTGRDLYKAQYCRSANRNYHGQSAGNGHFGFRLALVTNHIADDDIIPPPPSPPVIGTNLYMVVDLVTGKTSYLNDVPADGWSDEYKTTKMVLRRVSPGKFEMGSPTWEVGRDKDEVSHEVTLTNAYYIGVFEMTQSQYKQIVGRTPSYFNGEKRPVDSVSYVGIRGTNEGSNWPMSRAFDENSFLGRLQEITQLPFDLPTEAQWEYACRAGTTVAWNNGEVSTGTDTDPELDKLGRYAGNSKDGKGGYEGTTTVGSYLPNAWGLYDMHGNVNEWCLDFYDSYSGDATEPVGPNFASDNNNYRVLRGGGTTTGRDLYKAQYCRSANRDCYGQSKGSGHFGFRLVLVVGGEEDNGGDDPPPDDGLDDDDIKDGDEGETETYLIVNLKNGKTRYRDTEPSDGWLDVHKTTKMVLRRVSPGTFEMGSPTWEVGRYKDEVQHEVTLTNEYYIGVFEITQSQYRQVIGQSPSYYKGDMRPVDSVSYVSIRGTNKGTKWPMGRAIDEDSFLGRLQEITQLSFDLPTEAQWEYACRAGTTVAWNNGEVSTSETHDPQMDILGRYYYNSTDGKGGYENTTKVGSYLPNAWGLYDMHGNVYEWCLDWYGSYSGDATEPVGPNYASDNNNYRIIRGGGVTSGEDLCKAKYCRSAQRVVFGQSKAGGRFGFRVVLIKR